MTEVFRPKARHRVLHTACRVTYSATVLLTLVVLLSLALWREWSLRYDTAYPARLIFENNFFQDDDGQRLYAIAPGQTVNYRKAFCVSLDDPDRLLRELVRGEREFVRTREAVLQEQTQYFGTIYGLTRATFLNGLALQIPDRTFEIQEGCYDIVQSIRIPNTLADGEYVLVFKFTYYRNRWQKGEGVGVTRAAAPIRFRVESRVASGVASGVAAGGAP